MAIVPRKKRIVFNLSWWSLRSPWPPYCLFTLYLFAVEVQLTERRSSLITVLQSGYARCASNRAVFSGATLWLSWKELFLGVNFLVVACFKVFWSFHCHRSVVFWRFKTRGGQTRRRCVYSVVLACGLHVELSRVSFHRPKFLGSISHKF